MMESVPTPLWFDIVGGAFLIAFAIIFGVYAYGQMRAKYRARMARLRETDAPPQ